MSIIDESALNGKRDRDLGGAFAGMKAALPGLNAVRRPSALVVDLLRRSNNFFATGNAGLIAVGIVNGVSALLKKIDGEPNPDFDSKAVMATIPQIAEAAALLICTEEDLDACDEDISAINKLRRGVMRSLSPFEILDLIEPIQGEFDKINRSSATVPEDEHTPAESLIDPKKKLSPVS